MDDRKEPWFSPSKTRSATVGGTATAGYGGTATAGVCGVIVLTHWDGMRWRLVVRRTNRMCVPATEPNVPYKLDNSGKFVRADRGVQ